MNAADIGRRPAGEPDLPFLFELYSATRAAELAVTPWNAAQKRAFLVMQFQAQLAGYRSAFPQGTHEIVTLSGLPAGRLYLARLPDCLRILDITVAPDLRNGGIGSAVIREILAEAERLSTPVTIYVESFNPSLSLFQRLGFRVASQESFQLYLEHAPALPAGRPAAV